MPVIQSMSEPLITVNNFSAFVPGAAVAAAKIAAQVMLAGPALQMVGILPIPVLPLGAAAGMVLLALEYTVNDSSNQTAAQASKALTDYNRALQQALAQRKAAVAKLYADEEAAQQVIIKEYNKDTARLAAIPGIQLQDQNNYNTQIAQYYNTLYGYSNSLAAAKLTNDKVGIANYTTLINNMSTILIPILQIQVDIIMLNIEKTNIEMRLAVIEPLVNIALQSEWTYLNGYADAFGVSVPYYPDLPSPPAMPFALPSLPENCLVDKGRQVFAKWLVTPTMIPLGLAIATIFECLRAVAAPLDPANASKMESMAGAIILQLGMAI